MKRKSKRKLKRSAHLPPSDPQTADDRFLLTVHTGMAVWAGGGLLLLGKPGVVALALIVSTMGIGVLIAASIFIYVLWHVPPSFIAGVDDPSKPPRRKTKQKSRYDHNWR